MNLDLNNVYIWDSRMRNPKSLTVSQKDIIQNCPYLSRVRSFSEYTSFNEYYGIGLHRSFTWACNENCICLKSYFL